MFNNFFKKRKKFNSKEYWENRYQVGGTSGNGSYNNLSIFKADVINKIIHDENFNSVIEFGVGDGHQLSLMSYNKYLGLDVSSTVIQICIQKFHSDFSKSFMLYDQSCFNDPAGFLKADVSLSLDVIYHLIEVNVYEKYLSDLFNVADKMVIVYSTNQILPQFGVHEKHRVFTKDVERLAPNWMLKEEIKNKYTVKDHGEDMGSRANFFIYIKK